MRTLLGLLVVACVAVGVDAGGLDSYVSECANPAFDLRKRVSLVESYAGQLCDAERYDEAVKLVVTYLPQQQTATPTNRVPSLLQTLAGVYVYADRMNEALDVAKRIGAIDRDAGARRGVEIARTFDRADLERSFVDALSDPACFALYGGTRGTIPDHVKVRAEKYVLNQENPASSRLAAFVNVFAMDNSQGALAGLDSLLKLTTNDLARASFNWRATYKPAFVAGDWKRTVAYYRLMAKCGGMAKDAASVKNRRLYVLALANAGERRAAAEACDEFARDGKIDEVDAWGFRYIAAMVRGEKVTGLLKDAALADKDKASVLQMAGRNAQTMELTTCAEELAKEYAACFRQREDRSLAVVFSANPIRSVSDWRAIHPTLPKAFCDQPFGADVEALKTDVNTQRTITGEKKDDNLAATVEITAVCDRYALHVFLRVADGNARKVEHGFANGIRTETYFAPGDNVAYQCLGAQPLKGVTFVMNTLYDSMHVRRLKDGDGFRSEVAFSDNDYVTHLVFDWSNFYDKLPKDGGHYRFECLCWAPGGHKTWAGSRGIHHSSDWGRLVFSLKPEEIAEIRRELVLFSYRNWQDIGTRGARDMLKINAFTKWSDATVGDPNFYENDLKDMQTRLTECAGRVKPEMDDATVNEIFENAVPSWMGLRHVIDAKRKAFLGDRLIATGE